MHTYKEKSLLAMSAVMVLTALTMFTSSCKSRDVFDAGRRNELVQGEFPIDTVDVLHTWNLVKTLTYYITADIDEETDRVEVLTDNPYTSATARIIASAKCKKGQRVGLPMETSNVRKTFYAAAVTKTGKYYVVPFGFNKDEANFTSGGVFDSGDFTQPKPQAFTYLFTATFPEPPMEPEVFDYNDVVLRVAKEAPSSDSLLLHVTLAAVGTTKQCAAAIRIDGLSSDAVESVSIISGKRFDDGYMLPRTLINSESLLRSANDGYAIISLFEDAHWALLPQTLSIGGVAHLKLNTEHYPVEEKSDTTAAKTVTYLVKLKGADARNIRMSSLDPFIVESYNGANFEVHCYPYKFKESIWAYLGGDWTNYDDKLAWALCIPTSDFQWPLEQVPLCNRRNGELFGAYNKMGHSFGEWAHLRNMATDWYMYPMKNLVY